MDLSGDLPDNLLQMLEKNAVLTHDITLSACADLSVDGRYCIVWLVIAAGRFMTAESLLSADGSASLPARLVSHELKDITEFRTYGHGSGGSLLIKEKGILTVICRFTGKSSRNLETFIKYATRQTVCWKE